MVLWMHLTVNIAKGAEATKTARNGTRAREEMHRETKMLQGVKLLQKQDKPKWESSQLPTPQFCREVQMH